MSIANFQQLVSYVQDYSLRSDAPIPLLIGLLESDIRPLLTVWRAETSTDINIPSATKTITLPTDYVEMRAIFVDGKVAKPISIFDDKIYHNEITYYKMGNQLVFNSIGEIKVASLVYYATIPSLTSTQTSNWLLSAFPNVYLFGTLAKLYHWARDEEGKAAAQQELATALQQLTEDDKKHIRINNPIPREVTQW
ncbi:phage adaptor protein [Agrobacterium tumefaciens]|uniref:Uncharacterized protein n=1 Tax=Agrobacterium tumefaciens TaxID=358 RepID=A0AA44JBM2_AGRTU|nr:hypothetical protein [Agrobacterium tumefaciens]NTB86856.1 hypothetical protein [Agrobacterium tumefaciens]NTC21185.1 hypothetical protein [Agrobacterium tumefaciens]NTC30733.1 hypothetical protein [Agrobacterium tumefaciens]